MTFIWTHTNLADFENCPRKFHHKYILKDLPKEPESEAMAEGILVHKLMEDRLGPLKKPLPESHGYLERWAAPIAGDNLTRRVEDKLGITIEGKATGFFDPDVWGRGKVDVVILTPGNAALLFDWKTGKRREDPTELSVFALLVKAAYKVDRVFGHYVWLKEGDLGVLHDLSDVGATWHRVINLTANIAAALSNQDFQPTPNPLCGWCPVKSCPHNKDKR